MVKVRDELVPRVRRVVQQDCMVSERDGDRKVPQASFIAPANIGLRYIMPTECHPIRDAGYVDVGVLCPNVNKDDLKSALAGVGHHLQIIVAGERGLHRKTATISKNDAAWLNASRPAARADGFLELTWMVRAMASGSIRGKCRKISEAPAVRLLLPEPFGPATTVKLGVTL